MAIFSQRFDSRQNMKNKRFEIFHYREAKPEAVGFHHHDFYEIYCFLGGEVSFRVEEKTFHLEPGDLLLIHPQELHQPLIQSGVIYERMVLWIDRNYLNSLCTASTNLADCFENEPDRSNRIRPSKISRAVIWDLLEKLNREAYSKEPDAAVYAEGLLLQLLVEINRLARKDRPSRAREEGADLVSRIVAYISSHYEQTITLEGLSKEFYVSKYYLSHEFKRRTGTGIYQYVLLKRLMLSREMMAAGHTPGEVYKPCGFGDYSNFYRAFKAEYGISPREFATKTAL